MIELHVLLVFFMTSVVLALTPGPDNLFVFSQSVRNGSSAGFFVTLGLCTGLIGHTTAVAFGLAAVVRASVLAFTALKFIGAAYLLYLAWGAFRAGVSSAERETMPAMSKGTLFRRGIFMNLSNPKVSLFFLAFLPQFADPSRGSMILQFFQLGGIFIFATVLVFGLVSILAGGFGEKFRESAFVQTAVNRAAGTIFVGLALKLAFSER